MRRGRPLYRRAGETDLSIQWSHSRKAWRLAKAYGWRPSETLQISEADQDTIPTEGWTTRGASGTQPPIALALLVEPAEIAVGHVPAETASKWDRISDSLGCQVNEDWPAIAPAKEQGSAMFLAECMSSCEKDPDCVAVDWTADDARCVFFSSACTKPKFQQQKPSSWVLKPATLKQKACDNWNGKMEFLGQGWLSTEGPVDEVSAAFARAFDSCEPGDTITLLYAEKDVGYKTDGTFTAGVFNTFLQHINRHFKLFHSGVRFVGCGRSLMLQLQARAWGFEGAYGVSFPHPVVSPDNRRIWDQVLCDVPGVGQRDNGMGNIIFYRIVDFENVVEWARGEREVVTFRSENIQVFLGGLAKYMPWWNVKSNYLPESVRFQDPSAETPTLVHEALVCDTFALWVMGQGLSFALSRGYPLDSSIKLDPAKEPKWNRFVVTLKGHDIHGPAMSNPQLGAAYDSLEGLVREGALRSLHPAKKVELSVWEAVKGHGHCDEIDDDSAKKTELLDRKWMDPSVWSKGNWTKSRHSCINRIYTSSLGVVGHDMVAFGPRRFFALGARGGGTAWALDWDTKVEASYDKPFPLYDPSAVDSKKIRLPGGTPRGPFAQDSVENPCGSRCPWEFPVVEPPPAGYAKV